MSKYPQLRCYGSAEEMFHPVEPAQAYRNYLENSCRAAKVPQFDTDKVMRRYDVLAESGGPQMALEVTLGSLGVSKETIKKTVKTIKDTIQESLEKFNREHKGIDVNPISRLAKTISTHNALLEKLQKSVLIGDELALDSSEVEKIKIKLPEACKRERTTCEYYFSARASEDESDSGLALVVKF